MGNWSLEIFKMAMYIAFPVGMFHIFNQPAYFEEWVTKTRREFYPPENLGNREAIQHAIREHQEKEDLKMIKAYQDIERKQKM